MKVEFTRKFENQVERLPDAKLKLEIANAVRAVMAANTLHDIPKLKKLSGFRTAFRIRTGNYWNRGFISKRHYLFCGVRSQKKFL